MKLFTIAIAVAAVGWLAIPAGSLAQEPAHCLAQYAPLKKGCDDDLRKCQRHVQLTGERTSCDEQYAFCQKHWKEIIADNHSECFAEYRRAKPGRAVLQSGCPPGVRCPP